MIDSKVENIYNIMLSIFLGIIIVLLIDQLYEKPITVNLYVD